MGRVVVLLGPPGSGKSTIGAELGRRGLRWRAWEPWLLEHWGSGERFAANKAAALASLHAAILGFIDADPAPAVIESTGLSDRDFLDALQRSRPDTLVVRLEVSEAETLRRVAQRAQGEHLNDAAEANRAVWAAFQELVVPNRPAGIVIDVGALTVDAAAEAILARLRLNPSDVAG